MAQAHILIVNQHGKNRGDEAAMRAMLKGFAQRLDGVRFTIVHQARPNELSLDHDEDVEDLSMIIPLHHALGFVLFSVARCLRVSPRFLLTRFTRPIIEAYERADLVVSAPGGPYFGDLYRGHELVHWFYVWLAWLYGKPLFLYAPSAGPFRTPILNSIRRFFFSKFDGVCLREQGSADHLRTLCDGKIPAHVTIDSALQRVFEPLDRCEYFQGERAPLREKFVVAVSALRFHYSGMADAPARREEYQEILTQCVEHLAAKRDCLFLLIPQLHGGGNSDVPYLEELAAHFPEDVSWEMVDPELNSDAQQRIFAMSDFCIASRYHPQVFAAAAGVPGVCIYYEHKAYGFMKHFGMEDLAFDIRSLSAEELIQGVDMALERSTEISQTLTARGAELRELSRQTTDLAVRLLEKRRERSDREPPREIREQPEAAAS